MPTEHRRSPMELRDGLELNDLETYQPPRTLIRQTKLDDENTTGDRWPSGGGLSNSKGPKNLRKRSSQKISRLSSLDSYRTSSSMESSEHQNANRQRAAANQVMPLISITCNDSTSQQQQATGQEPSTSSGGGGLSALQKRRNIYRDYYGRPRVGLGRDKERGGKQNGSKNNKINEEDSDDEDAFEDSPLPMPYSSNSISRTMVVRQQTDDGISYPSSLRRYEELLDDRQGMNNSEQQFTKGEKANRPSVDGSITSEFRSDNKRSGTNRGGGSSRKDKQRRSKSPSSSSVTNMTRRGQRQSRKGFLGFASRLKLTKKHESIAKLQLSILNSGLLSPKTLYRIDRDLLSFLPKDRLTLKDFEERVQLMRKYEILSTIEYRFASKYETYVCKHALQESNQAKNNYKKCIPYDYNRVVLKTLPNVPDSDYINASHVDSCLKPNAYIAAQGPNEFTINDFWRMIWEQKTFVIVMLTKVFDFIRVMCNQYWPVEVNKPERYGNLEVTLLYEEPLADFVIRTIKLTKLKGNQAQDEAENQANNNSGNGGNSDQKVDQRAEEVGIESDEEDLDYSDDTSADEEIVLNNVVYQGPKSDPSGGSSQNLSVRAPRFVARRSARRSRERSTSPRLDSNRVKQSQSREVSPALSEGSLERRRGSGHRDVATATSDNGEMTSRVQLANEFLHPLFNGHLGASSTSLNNSEPNSPMTPRTPSSAGLDRSSATRKAVKKKRRARVKNQRPKRTQFMVPSESQLVDDDDDDVADETSGKANERIIYQFHYNSWASHTCPFISSLLHFRRRVRICMDEMSKSGKTGPTVVHCNDGCGRTGTYLCIDANLELAEEDNVLDVYNYTKKMRQSRKFLIENLEQYKFVYDTIEETMFCGKTWFPVSELHKRLKHKSQRNSITKKNEYLREYEKICRMTSKFSIGDCAGGHRVENREKNRDVSTVPPDNFRPYLTSFQTNDSTDYINAVFVDGYTRSKEYIVTEWPLHRTISDFWSLVYDHDCNSVILLANPGESSAYPSFLPSEKELRRKFGPVFSAEMVSYTHYQNIKSWIYTINKKIVSLTEVIAGVKSEAKTTQVFQITCWPQGHRVPTSTNALVELMNMVERWRQRTTYGPVCVVSLNGKSRAGVYCAANVAIEQVVQHSEVDVFQAVKTVRRHRPQLIENMTEYKYCYDLILHYVLHYVNNQSPGT